MYTIKITGANNTEEVVYDPRNEDLSIISAVIELEANTAGTATLEIPFNHPLYSLFTSFSQGNEPKTVTFYDDAEILFRGHITETTRSMSNTLTVSIIGVLAELANVTRIPYDYSTRDDWRNISSTNYVKWLFKHLIVDWYNNNNDNFLTEMIGDNFIGYNHSVFAIDNSRFTITNEKGNEPALIFRKSDDYLNLWQVAENDFFGSELGGYLYPIYYDNVVLICYEKNFSRSNSQVIKIGENLVDQSQTVLRSEYITAIRPIGKDGSENVIIHGYDSTYYPDEPHTRDEINDTGVYYYEERLFNLSEIESYGLHEETVYFDDVLQSEVVSRLIPLGVDYLKNQTLQKTIEVTGFDLGLIDSEIQKIRPFSQISVILAPNGESATFNITKMTIDVLHPQNTRLVLNTQKQV